MFSNLQSQDQKQVFMAETRPVSGLRHLDPDRPVQVDSRGRLCGQHGGQVSSRPLWTHPSRARDADDLGE